MNILKLLVGKSDAFNHTENNPGLSHEIVRVVATTRKMLKTASRRRARRTGKIAVKMEAIQMEREIIEEKRQKDAEILAICEDMNRERLEMEYYLWMEEPHATRYADDDESDMKAIWAFIDRLPVRDENDHSWY